MDKDKVLKDLEINRNIEVPFEVTTKENTYRVYNFDEYDEESVELNLGNELTEIVNYDDINYIYLDSQYPKSTPKF